LAICAGRAATYNDGTLMYTKAGLRATGLLSLASIATTPAGLAMRVACYNPFQVYRTLGFNRGWKLATA